jgi:3-deoxy-D-manno-octulosonic-acid transferase
MKILYNLGIQLFNILMKITAPVNTKASQWVKGRKDWATRLKEKINSGNKNIWIHCASLGEFEQGRPFIEMIRKLKPEYKILLTFFSPSGFEIRKDYGLADYVCYLPVDTPQNASRFISLVNPSLAIFVKYEFWNNYILTLSEKQIPLYLISGIFRPGQHFFKWYGTFFRKVLSRINYFFVQDKRSKELLQGIGITDVSIAGDTRFDRVVEIAREAKEIPVIKQFRGEEKLFLAGSSWPKDEEIISRYINSSPGKMKWVFAPHEIDSGNIDRLEKLLSTSVVRFSKFTEQHSDARVLIIDNIGILASAYRYASLAEIGGGFGAGIHNVLEASCWGVPVMFGPRYGAFKEAVDLVTLGGARCFRSYSDFTLIMDDWLSEGNSRNISAEMAQKYVRENTGATAKIFGKIFS